MKRRSFLKTAACTAVCTSETGCEIDRNQPKKTNVTKPDIDTLAGYTREELRELYRYDLFDDFLPFMEKYVIDHEEGGFKCNTDRDGTNLSNEKRTTHEGRGTWVYSFLYNKIDNDTKYLEVARKSIEYMQKNKPDEIENSIFMARGYQEYSKAEGNEEYWDKAKDILFGSGLYRPRVKKKPEISVLENLMTSLRQGTEMLENHPDPEIETLLDRIIDDVMNHHFNPEYRLFNEHINADLSRIEGDHLVFGHSHETMWMMLYEAHRRKDWQLFNDAASCLKRHTEVFWDDVYGGLLHAVTDVETNTWDTIKALWLQEEVLIGLLFIIEHTGADWAKEWYSRLYTYVREKFPLKQYGFPIWILYADRKVTFERNYNRVGNFHHPRHLMLNLLAIERMIKNNGKSSGLIE